MVRQRIRIRFRKQGDLRLVGHRDLVRSFERLCRRAGLRLSMSEGFHPKPRISFPSALAVGIEGIDEVLELELAEPCTAEELHARLSAHAPPGLSFSSIEVLPPGTRKAQLQSCTYEVPIPAARADETAHETARLLAGTSCPVVRPGRTTPIDLRSALVELALDQSLLRMRLLVDRQGSAGPRDVLAVLGLGDLEQAGVHLTRTSVELAP